MEGRKQYYFIPDPTRRRSFLDGRARMNGRKFCGRPRHLHTFSRDPDQVKRTAGHSVSRACGFILALCCVLGCKTIFTEKQHKASVKEFDQSIGSVAEAISGKALNKQELEDLRKKLRTDEETQSAIRSITDSLSPEEIVVKYCPLTGKRYAPRLIVCPEHHIELKTIEE